MTTETSKHSLLFIDDEENVLKSLKRIFEDDDYHIFTASGGEEALDILKTGRISLLVCDNRMPRMDGVTFFQKAISLAPEAVRIMLTGFADVDAVMNSINKGEVYRYIAKPWKDDELKAIIRDGLEHYDLIEENKYLTDLTLKQNQQLKKYNKDLENKVEERTKEIQEKNIKLEQLYQVLEKSLVETVRIITKVLEIKDKKLGAHSKRVTALAVSMAKDISLSAEEVTDIELGALLHDIGKVNIPSFILYKKATLLTQEQKDILRRHPVIGNLSLASIPRLKKAAEIVLHHHENVDGSGYPYGLQMREIPVGSRIIAVADAFDNLTSGDFLGNRPIPSEEAFREIEKDIGARFDMPIVESLGHVVKDVRARAKKRIKRKAALEYLRDGMVLAADIVTESGIVLMLENDILNKSMIEKIKQYVDIEPLSEQIIIYEDK